MKRAIVMIAAFAVLLSAGCLASPENTVPGRTGRWVNDYANVIDGETARYLEKRISSIRQTTPDPVEIIVATFRTVGPMGIEDFTRAYGEKWRESKKGRRDNGVIIVLALKERRVMIGVGKNLEGVFTARDTARIINEVIAPYMSREEYALGIKKGVEAAIEKLENVRIPMGPAVMITRIGLIVFFCYILLYFARRRNR